MDLSYLFCVLIIFGSFQLPGSGGFESFLQRALQRKAAIFPNELNHEIIEDAFMTGPELLTKYNYPVEVHTVITQDGYMIDIHRIPKHGGIPVYLMHGVLDSSDGWIMYGPEKSFAYLLSDLGYDVWLGNARGNRYSRRHLRMKPLYNKYWDFSFHEIGIYDLPASIDYIISVTGYPQIHYVGYSQGSTSFWIMCSEVPGYCDKIISMNALAPVAYLGNSVSPLIVVLAEFINQLEVLAKLIGIGEFFPNNKLLTASVQLLCRDRAKTQILCWNGAFFVVGYNTELLNTTSLPILFGHFPAGSAVKQLIHYGQFVKTGTFRKFDYGPIRNQIRYGQIEPPDYDLTKITAPVALHYGRNDWLTVPEDVRRLAIALPNLIDDHMVAHPKFTHGDFMYANGVRTLVYNRVISIMQAMETKLGIRRGYQ